MSFETIKFHANGREFEGWESVSVTAGIAQAAREFDIQTTEIVKAFESPFDKWHFPPLTVCGVYAGSDLLVGGLVDEYLPSMSPESHSITIKGRGLSSSIVDSSAKHETGRFENQSVLQILQTIAKPFGVKVQIAPIAAAAAAAMVPVFQLRRGELAWTEMTRLINDYAFTLSGLADGHLIGLRAGNGRHAGAIAQGDMPDTVRIKEGSARIATADRFKEYSVVYQQSLGADLGEEDIWEGEANAVDNSLPIYRFSEIIAATEMTPDRAKTLAEWAARRAAGFATQATLVVPGFRDIRGTIWEPGHLVFVFSPFLKLEQDMVITEVTFSQDNERGTISTLTVMNPSAFFGEGIGNSGSDPMWDMPDFDVQ